MRPKVQLAKDLRKNMTPEEQALWKRLRGNQLHSLHFRRQQVIDGFIADFYCHAGRLVVEVDGGVHEDQREYDAERDRIMTSRGLRVFRVTNEEIQQNLEGVLERIASEASGT